MNTRKRSLNSPFPSATDTSEHDGAAWIVVELTKGMAPVFEARLAVNSLVAEAVFSECLFDQVKHLGPATENDAGSSQLYIVVAFEQKTGLGTS